MTEKERREPEMSRREAEEMRADIIKTEMAAAVRLLGAEGRSASEQNYTAARLTGLTVTTIERLRWRKIARVPADIADAIRDAVRSYNQRTEAKARHEAKILAARVEALAAFSDNSGDPDFYRSQVAGVVEQARSLGLLDRPVASPEED